MVPVYAAEIEDQLDVGELAAGHLVVASEIGCAHPPSSLLTGQAAETPATPPDLFPTKSVLARTGFNNNADFFPVADTWAARATIVHKLFNLRHNKDDIIGHQTAYRVVDADLKPVDETAPPPDAFSILDESVIYLQRGSDEKTAQVKKIKEEILGGRWWVSMEATMADFDYVLAAMPASGKPADADPATCQIVKRTEATAKLTKYLRQYKDKSGKRGPGVTPDGRLIGRVLRDFVFTGKGLVEKPANPTSAIYTMDDKPLSGRATAAAGYTVLTGGLMNEAEKRVAELEAALVVEKELVKATEAAKDAVAAQLADVAKQLADATAKLADVETAKRVVELTAKVKDAYKTKTDAEAAALAASLAKLSDADATAHLAAVAALTAPPAEATVAALAPTDKPEAAKTVAPKPAKIDLIKQEQDKVSKMLKGRTI